MGNIPGASPRPPVGIELQHKDELPRWNAPAASSPKWRASEGPLLAFDRKGSDSGHLVLESERRRAEGESQRVSRLSGRTLESNSNPPDIQQAAALPTSAVAKDSGSHGYDYSKLGPLEAGDAAHNHGQEAYGKSLAAHSFPFMDSLDSAFEAEPASHAIAVSSNGGATEEQQTWAPDAVRASGAEDAAKMPVDRGDTAVSLPVSTLVLERVNSMELSEGPEGGLAEKLSEKHGQQELPHNEGKINSEPEHLRAEMVSPLPSAGSIATALAFIPAEGISGQGSVELSGLPTGTDPSFPELSLPASSPALESMPSELDVDIKPEATESALAGGSDADVKMPSVAEPELLSAQALPDLGLQEAQEVEQTQGPEDSSATEAEAQAGIVAEVAEATEVLIVSSQKLPEHKGQADETCVMNLEPASLMERSGEDATSSSGPGVGSDPESSIGQAFQVVGSADVSTVDTSAMSPSPSQQSLQHSTASPSPDRIPSSREDTEFDFFVRLVNHRIQGDEQLAGVLPISPEPGCLEEACRDGVLLCKLLNSFSPDAIDERVVNQSRSCSPEKMTSPSQTPPSRALADHLAQQGEGTAAQLPDREPAEPGQQPLNDSPGASVEQGNTAWPERGFGTPTSSPDAKQRLCNGHGTLASSNDGLLSWQQRQENSSLCLNAARALGCSLAGITAAQLMDGQRSAVMACIREFVNFSILQELTVVRHPELMVLQNLDEDTEGVMEATPGQLMVLWLNHHLAAAGWPSGGVSDLALSLQDASAFCYLLKRLQPDSGIVAGTRDMHPWHRAETALALAESIAGSPLPGAAAMADAHEHLNLITLALLFRARHGLDAALADAKEQLAAFGKWLEEYDWADSREERTFRVWIGSLTSELGARQSLVEGLKDGFVLLRLLDAMAPGVVDWRRVHRPPFRPLLLRPHSVENCNQVMRIAREMLQLPLVNIGGEDIVNGQRKLLLAILRQLMRFSFRQLLQSVTSRSSAISDAELDREVLAWANAQVENSGKKRRLKSFNDRSLANGLFLVELLAAIDPACVNAALVTPGATPHDREMNAKYVVSTAKKLGCVVYTVWEDIVEVNASMILVFVASLQLLMLNKQPSQP